MIDHEELLIETEPDSEGMNKDRPQTFCCGCHCEGKKVPKCFTPFQDTFGTPSTRIVGNFNPLF